MPLIGAPDRFPSIKRFCDDLPRGWRIGDTDELKDEVPGNAVAPALDRPAPGSSADRISSAALHLVPPTPEPLTHLADAGQARLSKHRMSPLGSLVVYKLIHRLRQKRIAT